MKTFFFCPCYFHPRIVADDREGSWVAEIQWNEWLCESWKDLCYVPDYALVLGVPGEVKGKVDKMGNIVEWFDAKRGGYW